jgi:hypothetical protein
LAMSKTVKSTISEPWQPSKEILTLWPMCDGEPVSGNAINGLNEKDICNPTAVF